MGAVFSDTETAEALPSPSFPDALGDEEAQFAALFQEAVGHGVGHQGGGVLFALAQDGIHAGMDEEAVACP